MRFLSPVFLLLVFTMPEQTLACSCVSPDLQSSYESSENVFSAVITAARFDDNGNIEADFEVTEVFKGDVPFDKLRTTRSGTSCDASITVGPEYLIFIGNEGRFGGCAVWSAIVPGKPTPWLDILRSYKAGETPNLSSPWDFYRHKGTCSLSSDFRATKDALRGYIQLEYRRAGFAKAVFILPTRDEPDDAKIVLQAPGRDFVVNWSDHALPGRTRGAYMIIGDDVMEFARELLVANEVRIEGSLMRYPTLGETVIRTTNAGDAISDFVNCASQ